MVESTNVRDEAAIWFARMRRPDKERYNEAFQQWLTQGDHRTAYNRIASRFADAKILRHLHRPSPLIAKARRRTVAFISSVVATFAMCIFVFFASRTDNDLMPSANVSQHYSNERSDAARITLGDGSTVLLDSRGSMEAHITGRERVIWLKSGRARFTVAHGRAPFRVKAGNGVVTAHGTVFDVTLSRPGNILVALYSGSIDVAAQSTRTGQIPTGALRMKPGDVVELTQNARSISARAPTAAQRGWPEGILEFEAVTLGALVAEANRTSGARIVLADLALADMTLSGRFSVRDHERLADHSARIFGLAVDRSQPGHIILRRR